MTAIFQPQKNKNLLFSTLINGRNKANTTSAYEYTGLRMNALYALLYYAQNYTL